MNSTKRLLLALFFLLAFSIPITNSSAQSSTPTPSPDPTPTITKIIITEILPAPSDTQEWVELYNPTTMPVNLDGWYLEDQLASPSIIAELDGTINPSQALVVYLSAQKLNNSADGITLKNQNGEIIDSTSYNSSTTDLSWARHTTDLVSTWFQSIPTPGFFESTSPSPTPSPIPNPPISTEQVMPDQNSSSELNLNPKTPATIPIPTPSPATVPWWPDPKLPEFGKIEARPFPTPQPKNELNTTSSRPPPTPTTPSDVIIGGLLMVSGSGNLLISALRSKPKP